MKRTELAELGEFGLIKHLTQHFPLRQKSSIKGVGDDAAILHFPADEQVVMSTDLLVENIHFDLIYTPLKHLGYKSVAVNLSDIYAMNAQPSQITVSIAVSNRFSVEALEELYAGIALACEEYGVDLVGGDTSSIPRGLVISVTALGHAPATQLCRRDGAQVGDVLCVTGDLGGAYLGLQLLEREKQIYLENPQMQPLLEGKDYMVGRLLKPQARKDIYEYFQKVGLKPTAMLDVSDGLSSDLLHLCTQSGLGAFVEEAQVPIAQPCFHQALEFNLDPITCALHGGEDYELLFTIRPDDIHKIRYMLDIKMIGEMTEASEGLRLHTKGGNVHKLSAQGWRHV
jgi:thiamine-monophosphate kinase